MKTQRHGRQWLVGLVALLAWRGWAALGGSRATGEPAVQAETVGPVTPSAVDRPLIPTTDIWGVLHDAGPLMYAILLCSFALVTFFLERMVCLRRRRVIPAPFVTRFRQQLREGQLDRARRSNCARRTAARWRRSSPAPCENGGGRASRSSKA